MEAEKSVQKLRLRNIEMANYNSKYDELNKIWIREFWMLEDYDKKDLLNPQETNIDLGEEVFFLF